MFLSDGGFRFPIAHFPTAQCPASVLYILHKVLGRCITAEKSGIDVRFNRFNATKNPAQHYSNLWLNCSLNRTYFALCDGGDANRQFFKMHFSNCHPCDLHFIRYNIITEDPMVFLMDCKV